MVPSFPGGGRRVLARGLGISRALSKLAPEMTPETVSEAPALLMAGLCSAFNLPDSRV